MSQNLARHLCVGDTLDDILTHPAFRGFARALLPWDDQRYDTSMPLRHIGSLLPYHTHVDPGVVVSSINRIIDEASTGRKVFYDIYADAQKSAEPTRKDTGLFFFRGTPGAPFAVIAPGGGFAYVASVHEGFPHAVEISNRGYNAFVLKYRAGQGGRIATEDLAASLSYILRNAGSLGVATTDYSLWGSSAGARMAAAIGSYGTRSSMARHCRSHRPSSSCTRVIRIWRQQSLPRSWPLVTLMESPLPWSWKGGLRRCGEWGPRWSITSTRALVTGSALASGPAPKDGLGTLFASGRNKSSERPTVNVP